MVKGNDRWSVVSRWFVPQFQRFFMVKLWWEIYRSETFIFANVFVNLFVMDLEGVIFSLGIFYFFFFLSRQLTGATVSLLQVTMWIYKDSRFYTRRSYIRIFMLSFISIRRNIETMPLIKRHLTPSAWGMIRESRQLNYSKIYSKYDFVLDIFEYS